MARFGPFAAIERLFQSFNSPIVRNFVLISSLFFLSVITCSISKSWIAIYCLAYPSPWAILAMSSYSLCSTSSSLVQLKQTFATILGLSLSLCLVVQVLLLSQTVVAWDFFLHGHYESCSSLRQLLLWNFSVFCGSYSFVERKKYFVENISSMAGGMGCVEMGYLNGEKDR